MYYLLKIYHYRKKKEIEIPWKNIVIDNKWSMLYLGIITFLERVKNMKSAPGYGDIQMINPCLLYYRLWKNELKDILHTEASLFSWAMKRKKRLPELLGFASSRYWCGHRMSFLLRRGCVQKERMENEEKDIYR